MTRAEARALVQGHTKRLDTAGLTTSTLINSAINMARKEIQQWYDFSTTVGSKLDASLAVDASRVALESDVLKVIDPVTLVKPNEPNTTMVVHLKPKQWVKERYPQLDNGTSGCPVVCYVDVATEELVFVPPVTEEWTVQYDYFTEITDFTSDADVLEAGLENSIVCWATAYVFKSTQQREEADRWMRDYVTALALAKSHDLRDREDDNLSPFTQDGKVESTKEPWQDFMLR